MPVPMLRSLNWTAHLVCVVAFSHFTEELRFSPGKNQTTLLGPGRGRIQRQGVLAKDPRFLP